MKLYFSADACSLSPWTTILACLESARADAKDGPAYC